MIMNGNSDVTAHPCPICQCNERLKACLACRSIWYCSKEHQAQHWRLHKPQCQKHAAAKRQELPNDLARLTIQHGPQALTTESDEQDEPACKYHFTDPHTVDRDPSADIDSSDKTWIQLSAAESGEHDDPSEHLADASTVDRKLPHDLPSHITCEWLAKVSEYIVDCLDHFGCAVVDKLLGKTLGDKILDEAKSLQERHLMTDGQTLSKDCQSKKKYRMDKISWVNGVEPHCNNIGFLVTLLDNLMKHAQRRITQYSINGRTKAMVACYPGEGAGYVRHVDNPAKDGRLLTCIYYLNKDWDCQAHGGMLYIYPEGSDRTAHIEPIMDRLIVFWSDKRNPHEVKPAFQTRFAVTVWYFDAKERTEAIKREARKQSSNNNQISLQA